MITVSQSSMASGTRVGAPWSAAGGGGVESEGRESDMKAGSEGPQRVAGLP